MKAIVICAAGANALVMPGQAPHHVQPNQPTMVLPTAALKYTAAAGVIGGGITTIVKQRQAIEAEREKAESAVAELTQATNSVEVMRAAIADAKSATTESDNRRSRAESEVSTLKSALERKEKDLQKANEARRTAQESDRASTMEAAELKTEMAVVKKKLGEVEDACQVLDTEVSGVSSEAAALKNKVATAEVEVAEAAKKVAAAESALAAAETAAADKLAAVQTAADAKYASGVSELEAQVKALSGSREADLASATASLSAELAAATSKVSALEASLACKEDELCVVNADVEELNAAVSSELQAAYRASLALLSEATADADKLGKAWAALEKETSAEESKLTKEMETGSPEVKALNTLRKQTADLVVKTSDAKDAAMRATLALRVAQLEEAPDLPTLFASIDTDGSGQISLGEWRSSMAGAGMESSAVDDLFAGIDTDRCVPPSKNLTSCPLPLPLSSPYNHTLIPPMLSSRVSLSLCCSQLRRDLVRGVCRGLHEGHAARVAADQRLDASAGRYQPNEEARG